MKLSINKFFLASLSAAALTAFSFGEEVVTTSSTTTSGTLSEFSPDTLVVRSTTASEPIRYRYSKTTTYVDETGAPVSVELVKSGLPVTVYYAREGDQFVASKVIVRKATVVAPAPAPAPAVIEKKTTTTTTTSKKDDDKD